MNRPSGLPETSGGGNKRHSLLDPPEGFFDCLFDALSGLTGIDRESIVVSQRHLMTYHDTCKPRPALHKDRLSSAIAVGIPLHVPADSRLLLFPFDDVSENPFLTNEFVAASGFDASVDRALERWRCVEVEDAPGDLVVFRGSRIWHTRLNAAGASHLYVMVNDRGLDPLAEDPRAGRWRELNADFLSSPVWDGDLAAGCALSPIVDTVERQLHRNQSVTRRVVLWPNVRVYLNETEWLIVEALADGGRTARHALDRVLNRPEGNSAMVRLIAEGVVQVEDR